MKGVCFIWMRLKCRKAKLKQRVKVSLSTMLALFHAECTYNVRFFSQT